MRYFLDTEFNGMGGALISLALVSDSGRELYMASACYSPIPWVAANVMPIVGCPGATPILIPAAAFGKLIAEFLCMDTNPLIVADWPDDISYFCKTLIVGPGQMVNLAGVRFEMVRVDSYPTALPDAVQHNALWDARALRHRLTNYHPA